MSLKSSAIQPASPADFGALEELFHKANKYSLDQSGVPQWAAIPYAFAELRTHLKKGECFVIRDQDGALTSAIVLSDQGSDWGEAATDRQALYFYKLMKDPEKALHGEGARLLGFAATEASRRHKPLLRCDTLAEVPNLIDYYKRFGFEEKSRFTYKSSGRLGVLLEASADMVRARAKNPAK